MTWAKLNGSKPLRSALIEGASIGAIFMPVSGVAVVLAAGEGTRMKSSLPKVLHLVAGRSMLGHVLAAVADSGLDRAAVVVGPGRDDVAKAAQAAMPGVRIFMQSERLGTAHATIAARDAFRDGHDVFVLFADNPMIRPATIERLRKALAEGADVAALGFRAAKPTGYGRLIADGERLLRIVEEKDATPDERALDFCNGGVMALSGRHADTLLAAIGNSNAKG